MKTFLKRIACSKIFRRVLITFCIAAAGAASVAFLPISDSLPQPARVVLQVEEGLSPSVALNVTW